MSAARCWCGSASLEPFSADYHRCASCETLVLDSPPDPASLLVRDDGADFYGRQYYEKHLVDHYGYPPLADRARSDLPTRCLFWLRTLLKYRLPPGQVLEIGSAHGAFVALLRQAGYEAQGLELSPTVVGFAEQTFNVQMLTGPVEAQDLADGSLDAVVMMDVIEHLSDPLSTASRVARLLRPAGILLIQTPHYLEGATLKDLESSHASFLEQFKPAEHLFLFSQSSIRRLLERAGLTVLEFEPAFFAHYDMFVVAGRRPLKPFRETAIVSALERTPSGRMVQALLDVDAGRRDSERAAAEARAMVGHLSRQFSASERDRAARLEVIQQQGRQVEGLEALHHQDLARFAALEALHQQDLERIAALEAEHQQDLERFAALEAAHHQDLARFAALEAERQSVVAELDRQVARTKAEMEGLTKRLDAERESNTALRRELDAVAADRALALDRVAALERDAARLRDSAARLELELAALARERGERAAALAEAERQVEAVAASLSATEGALEALSGEYAEARREMAAAGEALAESLAHASRLDEERLSLRLAGARLEQRLQEALSLADTRGRRADILSSRLSAAEQDAGALEQALGHTQRLFGTAQGVLRAVQSSRTFAALRRLGRWSEVERATAVLLRASPPAVVRTRPPAGAEPPDTESLPPAPTQTPAVAPPETEIQSPSQEEAAAIAARMAAHYAWNRSLFTLWERHGFHVTPAHFYSPIPNLSALEAQSWPPASPMTGVDMNVEAQFELLESCRPYREEYGTFPTMPTDVPHEYYRENPMFRVVDAEILHCLLRHGKPRRVIEIGSGWSTLVAAAALERNAAEGHPGDLVAVEPYPNATLRAGFPGLSQLRAESVLALPDGYFDVLGEGDVLFIDSSHVVRIDSDVKHLMLDILPRLRPGVLVHLHDIFLPAEYPRSWVVEEQRFWNEQYLLHAFLLYNRGFEVVWAGSYMHLRHPDRLRELFPAYDPARSWPGSFWMRRLDT